VRAGRSVLLPDSLYAGNPAGSHWDYANPPGVDTCQYGPPTHHPHSAVGGFIRAIGLNQGVVVGKPLALLVSLRNELICSMPRGLSILPDEPMVERAAYENTQSRGRPYPGDADVQQVDATGV
jgi:hypothetical protein